VAHFPRILPCDKNAFAGIGSDPVWNDQDRPAGIKNDGSRIKRMIGIFGDRAWAYNDQIGRARLGRVSPRAGNESLLSIPQSRPCGAQGFESGLLVSIDADPIKPAVAEASEDSLPTSTSWTNFSYCQLRSFICKAPVHVE
jgi:hypothetical protein